MNIRYKLCLLLYYGFARHLPKSTVPVIGTAAKRMRGTAIYDIQEAGYNPK